MDPDVGGFDIYIEDRLFRPYILYNGILVIKMMSMSMLTILREYNNMRLESAANAKKNLVKRMQDDLELAKR